MTGRRDLSIFYLLGGIGFIVLAVFSLAISANRDSTTLLTSGGMALAGALAIIAYFGTRRGRGTR